MAVGKYMHQRKHLFQLRYRIYHQVHTFSGYQVTTLDKLFTPIRASAGARGLVVGADS